MKKILIIIALFITTETFTFAQNPLWLRYPAISPDGKFIAFTYKGDIYKVSADGGIALQITTNSAYDYKPVWSPDGKFIAFASDRFGNFDVYIVEAFGGKPLRLTFHSGKEIPATFTSDSKNIIFEASIQQPSSSAEFPRPYLNNLFSVPANGGGIDRLIAAPAQEAEFNSDMSEIVFQDSKSPENYWRKHQISSAAKDIFIYNFKKNTYLKITSFKGEDREPSFSSDNKNIFYLTEQFGNNFNVAKISAQNNSQPEQITDFKNHPVRFLSVSQNNDLCFGYNGEIYISKNGKSPQKINIQIFSDENLPQTEFFNKASGASEIALSPDGKEIAFIIRGNIFVCSADYGTTKQITETPEEERDISFSPDGKTLLFASEQNKKWGIYQIKIQNQDEKYFYLSENYKLEQIIVNQNENYMPRFSPDGTEIAFISDKTELKVYNIESKKIRTVLPAKYNNSYSDGDQYYEWSPDGKYFLVTFSPDNLFSADIALINADGKSLPINLTNSGYSDSQPHWVLDGNAMIWKSDKFGFRSHGGHGSEDDIFIMFFNNESFEKFNLTKEEFEVFKEIEKEKNKDKKNKDDSTKIQPINIELKYLEDRVKRLTINSSAISDAVLSKDGEKLFYLSKFEKGYDLWVNILRENSTKLQTKIPGYSSELKLNSKGDKIFFISGGNISKINTSDYTKSNVDFNAQFTIDLFAERSYLFEHVWRQMLQKFYVADMHGVDWNFFKNEYQKFLPHINNNYDFAEMLSEMLGELNASHTGSGFRNNKPGDKTSEIGIFIDFSYNGKGIKIDEVVAKSPLSFSSQEIKPGFIIEKIDGKDILNENNFFELLNRKEGKPIVLSIYNPETKQKFSEKIKPISADAFNELLYRRWVENRRKETYNLSGGKIGYIHIQGMNPQSFRTVFSDLLGKEYDKTAVVIDTRYNHGGWLHDDLATLFSGKTYARFVPRGKDFGTEPTDKWTKPSVLLVSEGNYSDGHGFPYVYKTLEIGKIVGMPVPGTMSAVWWETLIDNSLFFGMPIIGTKDLNGDYLENKQLEPDFIVEKDFILLEKGNDNQLKKAVEVLSGK